MQSEQQVNNKYLISIFPCHTVVNTFRKRRRRVGGGSFRVAGVFLGVGRLEWLSAFFVSKSVLFSSWGSQFGPSFWNTWFTSETKPGGGLWPLLERLTTPWSPTALRERVCVCCVHICLSVICQNSWRYKKDKKIKGLMAIKNLKKIMENSKQHEMYRDSHIFLYSVRRWGVSRWRWILVGFFSSSVSGCHGECFE